MWRDIIADNAKFSLDDALDMAQANYEDNFLDHWGLVAPAPPEWMEQDQWLECRRVYGLAKAIAESAATLLQRKGVGMGRLKEGDVLLLEAEKFDESVRDLLERFQDPESRRHVAGILEWPFHPSDPRTKSWILQNTLQLEAARLIPYLPARMAERFRALIGHLVSTKSSRAIDYLSRVVRCFLLDMVPEFAVMARAVLDVALQDMFPDEAVRARVGTAGKHVTLDDRLRFCDAIGVLDDSSGAKARSVKDAGDRAAHGELADVLSCEELLEALSATMKSLVRFETGPSHSRHSGSR